MIETHRNYQLMDKQHSHVHVKLNPVGVLDVSLLDSDTHYLSDLDKVSFVPVGQVTEVSGCADNRTWRLEFDKYDAIELNHLIANANEEFEILMKDL
jgi:hypothetical protein